MAVRAAPRAPRSRCAQRAKTGCAPRAKTGCAPRAKTGCAPRGDAAGTGPAPAELGVEVPNSMIDPGAYMNIGTMKARSIVRF